MINRVRKTGKIKEKRTGLKLLQLEHIHDHPVPQISHNGHTNHCGVRKTFETVILHSKQ